MQQTFYQNIKNKKQKSDIENYRLISIVPTLRSVKDDV